MSENIPIETLYSQPVVQQLLKKIQGNLVDIENIKIPYVIEDKVLMSPGIWNDFYYSNGAINDAFLKTRWDSKEIRSLYTDHEDNRAKEWIGEVINPRMKGEFLIGDLVIVDKSVAQKLAYGAKMGISPKVHGIEDKNEMIEFEFDNFSVVINPAVKTAYINNAQKEEDICTCKKKQMEDLADKNSMEENKMTDEIVKSMEEEPVVEAPVVAEEPVAEVAPVVEEVPEAPVAEVEAEPEVEAPIVEEAPVEEAPVEPVAEEMSEEVTMDLSDIADQIIKLAQMLSKRATCEHAEVKPKEEKPKEEKPVEEDKMKMKEMAETIKELSANLAEVNKRLNEPAKKAVKTAELSVADKGNAISKDVDGAFLSALQSMGGI